MLHLPALLSKNKELASQIKDVHETCAAIGYYLIGLRSTAGLFHHYVVRDTRYDIATRAAVQVVN